MVSQSDTLGPDWIDLGLRPGQSRKTTLQVSGHPAPPAAERRTFDARTIRSWLRRRTGVPTPRLSASADGTSGAHASYPPADC